MKHIILATSLLAFASVANAEWFAQLHVRASDSGGLTCSGPCKGASFSPSLRSWGFSAGWYYTALPVHLGAAIDADYDIGGSLRARFPLGPASLVLGAGLQKVQITATYEGLDQGGRESKDGDFLLAELNWGPAFVRWTRIDVIVKLPYREHLGSGDYGPWQSTKVKHDSDALWVGARITF